MGRPRLRRLWSLWGAGVLLLPLSPHALPLTAAAAAAPPVDEVVDKLQATCSQVQDLSARFHQTATNRSLNQVQEGSGLFLMKRPGKMRWEYQKPEERLFVTDGKTLWDFRRADKQVMVQEVREAFASRAPLSFLAGDCELRRDFEITAVEPAGTAGATSTGGAAGTGGARASPPTRILDLKPKAADAGIARIVLEVNLQRYTIEKTTLFDAYNNTTVIAFTNLKVNPGLSDQQFQFTPPAGVTVVTPPRR